MRTYLILGETGSGKSTFINMLGNYFSDGNLEDPPNSLTVLIPTQYLQVSASSLDHSENNVRDGTSSQTTEAQTYQWADPGVAFVDTPGFADTRGVETDDKNVLKSCVRTCKP